MPRHLSLLLCVVNAAVVLSIGTVALSTFTGLTLVPNSLRAAVGIGSFAAGAVLALAMLIVCRRDKSLSAAQRRRWELWLLVGGAFTSFVYFVRQARKGGA
jgi:biotin transporter BioY